MNPLTSNTVSSPPSRQVRRAQERREFKMLRSAVKRQPGGAGRPSA